MILEIINMYGLQLVGLLLLIMFGIGGKVAKRVVEKVFDTPVKMELARLVVQFVEQTCKHLHGEDKLNEALVTLADLLAQKNINATVAEMKVMIEAAVAEFNKVFEKPVAVE
jgi:hypothetical protein